MHIRAPQKLETNHLRKPFGVCTCFRPCLEIYGHFVLQEDDRTVSGEGYIIEQSPFADIMKDQASSSGSSNPPENKATGNLFGQSPAPDLLLLRKSTGKSKPALLPSFSEVASSSQHLSIMQDFAGHHTKGYQLPC